MYKGEQIKIGGCRNRYKAITGDGCLECMRQKVSFSFYRHKERPIIINGWLMGYAYGHIHCKVVRFGKKYVEGLQMQFLARDVRFIKAPSFCEKGWNENFKDMFPRRWITGVDGSSQPVTILNRLRSGPSWIKRWIK